MRKLRKELPATEYLRRCLRYNKTTGMAVWRTRPLSHFVDARAQAAWNTKYAGTLAGACRNTYGHCVLTLDNNKFLLHRIIWKYVTDEEPPLHVDHRNRKPNSNRWKNLRPATKGQNNVNSDRGAGVHFDKSRGNWQAYTKLNGKKIHLGRHPTKRLARAARLEGARRIHGEFAP